MACCGRQRLQIVAPVPPVVFEYVGRTTLRVVGPATRRDYWFSQPGARVAVDGRDAAGLAAVSQLRRPAVR